MHGTRLAERDGRSVDQRARPFEKSSSCECGRTPERTKREACKIGGNVLGWRADCGVKRKRREARKMKAVRLRVALTAALAAFLPATAGHQVQAGAQDVHARAGGIEAKFEYCTTCHGPSAQGFRGFYAMPRLAGQQPQYIENQLRAFLERRRLNPVMANVAHGITPDMIPALAARMRTLNPRPLAARLRATPLWGKRSSRMDCPIRMFPPVPLATDPTPGGSAKYLVSQASSIGTWSAPCRSGAANAARAVVRTYHGSCGQPWRI